MLRPGLVLVGVYAWTVTLAFGATLVDVAGAARIAGDRSEVGDLLLAIAALAVLTGIGAVAGTWGRKPARYLLLASLAVVVVGVLTPALVADIVRDAEGALGARVGQWVRLGEGGLASTLAFIGLWESWRNG